MTRLQRFAPRDRGPLRPRLRQPVERRAGGDEQGEEGKAVRVPRLSHRLPLPLFGVRLNPPYRVIQGIMEAFTEHFKVNSLVAAVSSKEAKRSVVRVATSFFLAHPTIGLRQERKS